MFAYTDPTGTGFLQQQNALNFYRATVHQHYRDFARLPGSAFTLLDAFDANAQVSTVTWIAFPRTATASARDIDAKRFSFQDEYVEWRVERAKDRIRRITFTTEFPEYYEALAETGFEPLVEGIRQVMPGAAPTAADLFGAGFNPDSASPDARASQFRLHLPRNPWNNGKRGILCLTQEFNTMGALFNLVGRCGVVKPDIPSNAVCANVGGACGSGRNSDPFICTAAQDLVRGGNGLSLLDPVGVRIIELRGVWKIDGNEVDINNAAESQGVWTIGRNGRRAVLDLTRNVTIVNDPIASGAQVSAVLQVGADVISAPDATLPAWAKLGQESSRQIV